jgi:sugar phosphate isomerase/epimerase
MERPIVGINLPSSYTTPQSLEAGLRRMEEDGFDTVEIGMKTFPLIIGGRIVEEYVEWLGGQLKNRRLRYSGHIDASVDLRSEDNHELNKRVLFSSIDICSTLDMSPLVLHFELESDSSEIEKRFYDDHREAADFAGERGVLLCMENIEVERVEPVIRMVRELNHPNFRMCFDVGHAYLAAGHHRFDFLDAVRTAADLIGHVHLSGNAGVFEPLRLSNRPLYDSLSITHRMAFGRGDIHAPPLWGSIPYDDVFSILRRVDCTYICEYHSDLFIPFNRSVQEHVRRLLQKAR